MSAQNPTDAEKLKRATSWAEGLFGIVPEHRLDETWQKAFKDHKGNFPVSAYDLKNAWNAIKVETVIAPKAGDELLPTISECDVCFGSKMEIVPNKGARKCTNC